MPPFTATEISPLLAARGGPALTVLLVGAMVAGYVVLFALWWFVFRSPGDSQARSPSDERHDEPRRP
jgi:hypothetical protein